MKRRSLFAVGALLVVLALAVSACGGGKSSGNSGNTSGTGGGTPAASQPKTYDPGITDNQILLGTFGPLTGPAAAWGDTLRGTEAYFNYINDQGGINGRKVKFIIEDDQYEPSKTVGAVKKMVEQDKVFALVNVIGTSNLSAVESYLGQNKVPVLLYSTGSTKFQNPVNPYFFQGLMPYDTEAKILVKYGHDQLKLTKYAVFYQNDDFGKAGLQGAKDSVAKLGGQVVAEVAYNPSDVDVSAYVLRMKESGAEAVLMWSTVKHGALVIKEAKKIGFSPKWMLSSVTAGSQLPDLTEGAADGAYTTGGSATLEDKDNPVVQEFVANGGKYLKGTLNNTQLGGWGIGRVAGEALKRAGADLSRAKLIAAMESLKGYQGLSVVGYTKDNHAGTSQGFVRQLKGTQYVKITDNIDTNY
jgi:ABC-type branched-subunit amino acid transport system substrate-binding protein